jgi:L-rhamnose mutarotase
MTGLRRFGQLIRVRPESVEAYERLHAEPWPAVLAALKSAGCRNYTIFIRGDELFGYLEVDDFAAFRTSMAGSPVDARWQAEMANLIDPMTDPATGFHQRLEEIFHLD